MLVWLIPIAVFWTLASTYLGGAAINFEGGGAGRQLAGLFVMFAAYLVIYRVLGAVLGGMLGPSLGGIALPLVILTLLIPILAKVSYKVVGVTITPVPTGAAAAH